MAVDIYKNDRGRKFILDVKMDVSASTIRQIKYRKPSGAIGAWDASLESDNCSISYLTDTGDLNEAGTWRLQAYIVTPESALHGAIAKINVREPL